MTKRTPPIISSLEPSENAKVRPDLMPSVTLTATTVSRSSITRPGTGSGGSEITV